jgi:hypothetical protein
VFTVFLDRTHRVLLSCFTGTFDLEAIAQCDRAVMMTLGREGPVRGIIDLTAVDAVDIPADRLRQRAQQPAMAAGQERIFVATSPSAIAFCETYSAIQRIFGSVDIQIVATRAEACRLLGLSAPNFEPLRLP